MLILARRRNEAIRIGENVEIVVKEIKGEKVRIGIQAPDETPIHREEVFQAKKKSGESIYTRPNKGSLNNGEANNEE